MRNYAIDLFRIVSMFMIVVIHVLLQGQVLWYVPYFSANYYVVWFIYMFVYCGLDCFAILSGYTNYGSKFKLSKLVSLWIEMVFYGLLFFGIFFAISRDNFDITILKKAVLPITTKEYWYMTAYFIVYLLSPFLSKAIEVVDRKVAKASIVSMFFLLTLPTFIGYMDPFGIEDGASVLWLLYLYLIGAYIRKYDVAHEFGMKKSVWILIVCFVVNFVGKVGLERISMSIFGEAKFGYHFVNLVAPFLTLEAIALLLVFANIKIKSEKTGKLLTRISATTLAVYLIHMNPYVEYQLLNDSTKPFAESNTVYMVMMVILYSIGFYVVSTIIDLIRIKLFELLKIQKICSVIDKKLGI